MDWARVEMFSIDVAIKFIKLNNVYKGEYIYEYY